MSDVARSLRRMELTSVAACAAMAVLAFAAAGPRAAAAVCAGGLLIAISYISMRSGTGALLPVMQGMAGARSRRQSAGIALKMAGRYALLALLAYVMIARLRLHPMGLLVGAASVAAAAFVEAVRLLTKNRP